MTEFNDVVNGFLDDTVQKSKREFNPSVDGPELVPFLDEAMVALSEVNLAKGKLNDIKQAAKEKLGIKPGVFSKILMMRDKRNRDEVEEQNEEILEIYDTVFPEK